MLYKIGLELVESNEIGVNNLFILKLKFFWL